MAELERDKGERAAPALKGLNVDAEVGVAGSEDSDGREPEAHWRWRIRFLVAHVICVPFAANH